MGNNEKLRTGTIGITAATALLKCSPEQLSNCVKMGLLKAKRTPQGLQFEPDDIDAILEDEDMLATIRVATPDINGKMTLGGTKYITSKTDVSGKRHVTGLYQPK